MTEFDPYPPFQDYANPGRLVSSPWLSARLGIKGLRVIEVDEDSLLYDIGHIPTATRINFHTELLDQNTRDIVGPDGFAALMRDKGINRDDTVVIYGDKSNWWAAFALWVFEMYGHEDVRLLDGGRDAWMAEERDTSYAVPEFSASDYPQSPCNETQHRAFVADLMQPNPQRMLIDTRSEEEYNGEPTEYSAMGDSRYGTTFRHGHIPGSTHINWAVATYPNSRFRPHEELEEIYSDLKSAQEVVLYSHVGAQGAFTWFVLKHLLGFDKVRNYDGAWAEWGNMVRMPIEKGNS